MTGFSHFLAWLTSHYIYSTTWSTYPGWILRLSSGLDYHRQCRLKHGVQIVFEVIISISFDIVTAVKLLDRIVALFLVFWETSTLFSVVAIPVYKPINRAGGLPFSLHPCQHYCLLAFWWWASSLRSMRYFSLWFCISSWLVILSISSCTSWPF